MVEVGQYCRQVEDYLTRANGGHLVRIVGPGFELVRRWAAEGIPLSVVFRGIDLKADRHRAGHSAQRDAGRALRPLRIEFCEADVRDVYDGWRRAVGLPAERLQGPDPSTDRSESDDEPHDHEPSGSRRRPSLSKHLDRAIERLGRAAGRLELPDAFREAAGALLQDLAGLRDAAKTARGSARAELMARLPALDRQLMSSARAAASPEVLAAVARDAESDLTPFRGRLAAGAWTQALDATVDRLLRDKFGLPTVEL